MKKPLKWYAVVGLRVAVLLPIGIPMILLSYAGERLDALTEWLSERLPDPRNYRKKPAKYRIRPTPTSHWKYAVEVEQ